MDLTPHQILDGTKLETILDELIAAYGWRNLGDKIPLRCFLFEPTKVSSLRFLRKNPEARKQVENLYVSFKQRPITER